MTDRYTIRPYRGSDEAALLATWNATMTHDRIDEITFSSKVLLDPNFNPEGLLVADPGDGRIAGFVLSLARQVPYFNQGLEPEKSWITAFGVLPEWQRQGIGTALFNQALERLRAQGHMSAAISPYTPNYFIPGVDENAYPAAIRFLDALGFRTVSRPISMRAVLTGFQVPPEIEELEAKREREDGITIRPVTSEDLPDLLPFLVEHFGWDWYRFASDYLQEMLLHGASEYCMLIARQRGEVVGYCQQRRERFGPFGVRPDMRNKGVGRLLLFRCLSIMLSKGFHCAWFLWTGEDAARLYRLAGFEKARQFAIMTKGLEARET